MTEPGTNEAGQALLLRVDARSARLLGLRSPKTVYAWIARGIIPPATVLRVGSAIYLRRQVLLEWANSANGFKGKR